MTIHLVMMLIVIMKVTLAINDLKNAGIMPFAMTLTIKLIYTESYENVLKLDIFLI